MTGSASIWRRTALAGQVVGEKLAARNLGEAKDARKVVELIEQGIVLSHQLAKGLHPVDMDAAGLMQALQEFTANTSELHKVSCRFECDSPVLIHDPNTAGHMFRIAQEAVRNAIKHSGSKNIVIRLDTLDEGLLLSVEDNGVGMPDAPRKTMREWAFGSWRTEATSSGPYSSCARAPGGHCRLLPSLHRQSGNQP